MQLGRGIISGGRVVALAELEDRIARAASGFEALGVGQGDCVAIRMRNDIPFLEASLAAQRLGAYAVPINWHFKPDEIAYILSDCAARCLIGHADLLSDLEGTVLPGVRTIVVPPSPEITAAYRLPAATAASGASETETWDAFLARQSPHQAPPKPPTQSMIYTSGTTGHPKGVRRKPPDADQLREIERSRKVVYGIEPGVRTLMPGPLYHAAPNSFALRAARIAGCLVLMPRFDAEDFLKLVERHRIDTLFMVPTMFVRLLKLPEAVRRNYDVSSLRFVMHAAAPCPPDVKRAMIDWWGPIVHEFYGATESGAVTVVSSEEWLARPGTVGRPVPGAVVSIQDEQGREVPAGKIGEVFTRVSYLPDFTYNNLAERRAEIDRGGLISCGDMGYVDTDGYLFLCDRKRDMVISGGVNIYPAEIEAALIAMPGVRDCAVFGIPDEEFGEALMAVVEPEPAAAVTPDAIRAHLTARIAGYKVPRSIEIRSGLPREDSGKIFKRRLRDPYWARAGRRI